MTYHIVGAGISGLILAYELSKSGSDVRIYERLDQSGGLARTEIVDGYRIDCGPHLYHTNNEDIKSYWHGLPGIEFFEPHLYGANYKQGKIYEYPLSEDSMKAQFEPDQYQNIIDELGTLDKTKVTEALNYKEYVLALAGVQLTELFFDKYPKKLWGIDTEDLSAKFAPRRVEIRKQQSPFHAGHGKWAGVIDNGCGHMAEIIEGELQKLGTYIEYNRVLSAMSLSETKGVLDKSVDALKFTDGKDVNVSSSDTVIFTIPITAVCEFFGIEHALWYRCLKIAAHVINRKVDLPGDYDWLYFDDDKIFMHRLTLQDSFRDKTSIKGKSILSAEIAYSKGDTISEMDADEVIERNIDDLLKLGFVKKDEIILSHCIDAGEVYPGIYVGYEEELSRINAQLNAYNNIYMHGASATYEYADLQVLTAKSIDLAEVLLANDNQSISDLKKSKRIIPADEIRIGNHAIGGNNPCYIIAEIGLNHNGSIDLAKKLILAAKNGGASAAKIQTYKLGRLSKSVRTARYYEDLVDTQESLSDYLDRIIFDEGELRQLFDYAESLGITLFSTPFDLKSLNMLENLNCPAYKVSSMDLVNTPLIKAVAAKGKPIILSTGMSDLIEISSGVETVLKQNNPNLILLHCVSSYPCPPESANLKMIEKIRATFETITGYSDHTTGVDIALASVALGAHVVEKHFTIDRKMDGPDQNFSILQEELQQLSTSSIRIHQALQSQRYGIMPQELETAQNLKRSLFYGKKLKSGDVLTLEHIETKSPGIGLHPKFMDAIIGRKISCDVNADMPISWEDFE